MAHFRQTVNGATTTVVADEAPEDGDWEEVQPGVEAQGEEGTNDDAGQQGFPPSADDKETGK